MPLNFVSNANKCMVIKIFNLCAQNVLKTLKWQMKIFKKRKNLKLYQNQSERTHKVKKLKRPKKYSKKNTSHLEKNKLKRILYRKLNGRGLVRNNRKKISISALLAIRRLEI